MVRLAAFPKCYLDDLIVRKTMSLPEWISAAAGLRVDGLEMHDRFFENDEAVAETKELCARAGLAIPMLCFSPDFTKPDHTARAQELQRQMRAIDLIARLGGRFCRTLSGQNRPGLDRRQAIAWCVEMIREAAVYAEDRGIILAMENHYKDGFWEYPEFAMRAEVFLEIVGQIDCRAFGINFDPSNAIVAGDDPLALLERIKHRVVTMHASDRSLSSGTIADLRKLDRDPQHGYAASIRHGVIGCGLNDYDAIFSMLRGAGFDGWVSIEDGMNGMGELRLSAEFLRVKINRYFAS